MTDRSQHTVASMKEQMLSRYNDGLPHKHNKDHMPYRQHYRTHPSSPSTYNNDEHFNESTGLIREFKLRKLRKRLAKGRYH